MIFHFLATSFLQIVQELLRNEFTHKLDLLYFPLNPKIDHQLIYALCSTFPFYFQRHFPFLLQTGGTMHLTIGEVCLSLGKV